MNVNRILRIREKGCLSRFRDFLAHWWSRVELDAILAPVELPDRLGLAYQVIEDPREVILINPFAPLMTSNIASAVSEFVREHPRSRLAVIMRSCELRTLVELQKRCRNPSPPFSSYRDLAGELVIIGVDCVGTLTAAEFARKTESQGTDQVTYEALTWGEANTVWPQHLRMACQLCEWPAPCGADLVIGTIGIVPDQYLLIIARDEFTDAYLHLQEVTDSMATEAEVISRLTAVSVIAEQRAVQRKNLIANAAQQLNDCGGLLAYFARCTLCADCLDACPLYKGELRGMLGVGGSHQLGHPVLAELVGVSRWLASCTGCGMCEEACEHGIPLLMIATAISHRIREELHYYAGEPEQRLPWLVG